jgi:protein-S-isoprenylcysteine O-methyltransferase Ste14
MGGSTRLLPTQGREADHIVKKGAFPVAKKILPPTYLLLAFIFILTLHFFLPVIELIDTPWNIIGAVPLGLGVVLNLVADREFKEHNTTVKPFEESNALITDGVFQISRHPMYLGFVLVLVGIAILLGTLSPFGVVIVFAILMEVLFIRVEEKMLEEKFGSAWHQYKARARRWI